MSKCPFLYDSCMCSIPEEGDHCPEVFPGFGEKCERVDEKERAIIEEVILDKRLTLAPWFRARSVEIFRDEVGRICAIGFPNV